MNTASVEGDRRPAILAEVVALAAAGVQPARRAPVEDFVHRYYGQVDAEDLAERSAADLCGAALSQWEFAQQRDAGRAAAARVQPDPRRARLAVDAHHRRDRQRRHAVPGRLGDDGGQPPRADAAPDHPSDRAPSRRDAAGALRPAAARGRGRRAAPNRSSTSRSTGSPTPPSARRWPPTCCACSPTCAPRSTTGRRCGAGARDRRRDRARARRRCRRRKSPRASPSCAGWSTTTSRFLGYRSHDLDRVERRGRAARSCRARSLGVLRERPSREVAAAFSALPPEVRAYARRPELLVVTKANARSTVHRPGYLDYVGVKRFDAQGRGLRRAPLPRPVHVDRLQRRARRDPAAAAQDRRRRRARRAAGRQPRRQGARQRPRDLSARRAVPDPEDDAAAHGDGDPAPRRPPALPPVRAPRSLRALRLLPHLRAARELHDRAAAEVAGDPGARPATGTSSDFNVAAVRVDAGARPDHGAHDAGQDPRRSTCASSRRGWRRVARRWDRRPARRR